MGVNNSEKFILEFSNHKRPHLTTDTRIKNNDKKWDTLLLGDLPSLRLSLFYVDYENSGPVFWARFWAHAVFHSLEQTI